MAIHSALRGGVHGAGIGQRLIALLHAFRAWNDARATRKALHKLTDRELEDIGLSRGDIDRLSFR
jgi:uncharacterized protein YjiS (DUF1127 family)